MYKALVKHLPTNENKTVKWTGARLDWFIRQENYLVTVTSDIEPFKAPEQVQEQEKEQAQQAELPFTTSHV
jgi:hypothetical protein